MPRIGTLRDDGKNGDDVAGDGVYCTTVLLDEPAVGRTALHVGGKGPDGEENAVALYVDVVEPIQPADLAAQQPHRLLGRRGHLRALCHIGQHLCHAFAAKAADMAPFRNQLTGARAHTVSFALIADGAPARCRSCPARPTRPRPRSPRRCRSSRASTA